jgi:hypothetical protein
MKNVGSFGTYLEIDKMSNFYSYAVGSYNSLKPSYYIYVKEHKSKT